MKPCNMKNVFNFTSFKLIFSSEFNVTKTTLLYSMIKKINYFVNFFCSMKEVTIK